MFEKAIGLDSLFVAPRIGLGQTYELRGEYNKAQASFEKGLAIARKQKDLTDLHNVRIRQTAHGLFVHYHCRFAGDRSVDHVHAAVDHIENGLQDRFPDIRRVIAHAEPIGRARHRL